jgi:hypothetical protein
MRMCIQNLIEQRGVWSWVMTIDDGVDIKLTECRTNAAGDGLWQRRAGAWGEEFKQVSGTCQFSLNGKSRAAAYAYIRRQFSRETWQ